MKSQRGRFLFRMALLATAASVLSLDASAAARAALQVSSFPPGGEIWIDGVSSHKTTPAILLVGLGPHQVMVSVPGGGWSSAVRQIVVTQGTNVLSVTLLPELAQGPMGPPGCGTCGTCGTSRDVA